MELKVFRELFARLKKSWLLVSTGERDHLLDFSKGIAIILVVVGHTIQGQSQDFDNAYGFRFIYSFHMPLFALLAGASAAFWIKKYSVIESVKDLITFSIIRIKKSAEYLLIPFFSWTFLGYWLSRNPEPIKDYTWKVINHPDYSLWFLPCIFWCTTYAVIFMLAISTAKIKFKATRVEKNSQCLQSPIAIALLMFLAWKLVSHKLPSWGGLAFTNHFHGGLFVFFLIGLAFFNQFANAKIIWLRVVPYIIFFSLVSFWHRTQPHNIIEHAPEILSGTWFSKYYALIVAVTGSFVFVDIAKILSSLKFGAINFLLGYIGSASLGIYAVHFYFLGYTPPIIAPIAISLLVWQMLSITPIFGKLLFGK
ncbi:uncharacterized protein NMK_2319 [Novimethylophilus kurashikiensis]|uniref:Acyltransferase 3 domain-containing protein n=1 Tax=Novimethylophilus kurashikiensis TaxID=1825523 RepID=A0A2R5FAZ0_9PROT|nr:acyltransferase family protein [Novimethylophilus kurashikiensis]GBG14718.1 uncharacterized protein NMK_2319 [Novimethylophilus kurashikiensis]